MLPSVCSAIDHGNVKKWKDHRWVLLCSTFLLLNLLLTTFWRIVICDQRLNMHTAKRNLFLTLSNKIKCVVVKINIFSQIRESYYGVLRHGAQFATLSIRFQEKKKSIYIIFSILTLDSYRCVSFTCLYDLMANILLFLLSILTLNMQSSLPDKCPAWKRSSVEFLPQFTFTVSRMRSVSEMLDTVSGVCPALSLQSKAFLRCYETDMWA